jgi:hypothetical protein
MKSNRLEASGVVPNVHILGPRQRDSIPALTQEGISAPRGIGIPDHDQSVRRWKRQRSEEDAAGYAVDGHAGSEAEPEGQDRGDRQTRPADPVPIAGAKVGNTEAESAAPHQEARHVPETPSGSAHASGPPSIPIKVADLIEQFLAVHDVAPTQPAREYVPEAFH